MHTGKGLKVH